MVASSGLSHLVRRTPGRRARRPSVGAALRSVAPARVAALARNVPNASNRQHRSHSVHGVCESFTLCLVCGQYRLVFLLPCAVLMGRGMLLNALKPALLRRKAVLVSAV